MTGGRNNHEDIKKQFLVLLEQLGENLNVHYERVLDFFFSSDQHFSAKEIKQLLELEGHSVEIETITDILDAFVKYGIARVLRTDDSVVRYEHLHINEHHDHLICTKCNRIIEICNSDLEACQEKIILENKFYPFYHRLQIYGICDECVGKRKQLLPLSYASIGEWVRIEKFNGGEAIANRLIDMGLQRGSEVKVLNNCGAYILQVGEKRMAIGRGMARKIIITPLIKKNPPLTI